MFRTCHLLPILTFLAAAGLALPAFGAVPAPVAARDWVFGNGTPGPFPLSWTALEFATERISVNGTPLIPGLDYRLDDETGQITFSQPLVTGQVAEVAYQYDPTRARANPRAAPVPLLLRLWGGGSGGLQMIGALQPSAADGQAPSASLLGFRGQAALGGSQFSSLFLLTPGADGQVNAGNWQRAALQLGASRTRGPFQFQAALSQAGAGYSPAGDYPLSPGLRALDLSTAFSPSKRVAFTSQVKRQDALSAAEKGSEQSSLTNQLTVAPGAGTMLTVSQESSRSARDQGPPETLDALRAQLEQKLGSGTTATLTAEQRRTDSTGRATTAGIDLSSQVTPGTRITAGFVQSANDRRDRDSTARVGLDAQAAPHLRLRAGFSHQSSAKNGRADALNFGLDAGPNQALALQGSVTQTQADKTGASTASQLQLTLRPASQLGFHIGFDRHLTPKQGSANDANWGISAGRHGLLTVESTTHTTDAGGARENDDQLQVKTSPLRGFTFATLTATKQTGQAAALQAHETSLEVSPFQAFEVTGALRDEETAGGLIHIRSVSGALKPAGFLDLSGTYKTHELPAGDDVVTQALQVALMPVPGFKLQGGYTENPEDDSGNVLPTTDTSLGLESRIGSLTFGGSYTQGLGDPNATGSDPLRRREQSEFRLALNLWGHTRFYSNYKESQERAGTMTMSRTLSLGFTSSLSSRFYLLLEGDLTEAEVNGVPQPGKSDERAQADLAMRF